MNLRELDEWQGLTADMVRGWLESHGWVQRDYEQRCAMYVDGRTTVCWVPDDFNASTIYGREQRQTMTATMVTLALRENRTVQAMLREINPRLRKGWPSDEAIAAAKKWVAKHPKGVIFVGEILDDPERGPGLAVSLTTRLDKNQLDGWSFWPCDEYGNKVRWPTDAEGKML